MAVAHIPVHHPYVTAVDPCSVFRHEQWSVAEMTERRVDIAHLHFGFEHLPMDELDRWTHDLERNGISLVYTVHDIDNPHLVDQSGYHRLAELLVERADAVTTLTADAATRIEKRWGRTPVVIPHPPLAARPGPRVGRGRRPMVWLGTLRPNVDLDVVRTIVDTHDASVDVVIRADGWADASPDTRAALLDADEAGRIRLSIVERPSDEALEVLIASAGSLVLPYAWGTHSGLVELATDLGVPTVTTPTGCRGGQGAVVVDADDLLRAARSAASGDRPPVGRAPSRSLRRVRQAHRMLYETVRSRHRRSTHRSNG